MKTSQKTEKIRENLTAKKPKACLSILNDATPDDLIDLEFLTRANDVQRALKNNKQALLYAELLKEHHPDKAVGYIRTAQELSALKCTQHAIRAIEQGLEQFPNHPSVLTAAHQVFSSAGDRKRSLTYAKALCQAAPENPMGFVRAAQDQFKLNQCTDALKTVQEGLIKHPNHHQILTIGIEATRQLNQTKASLDFAQSLVEIQPKSPIGYSRSAQALLALGRIDESLELMAKLEKLSGNNPECMEAARQFYRLIGDRKKSLQISSSLHQDSPGNTEALRDKISDLITLGEIKEAFDYTTEYNLCTAKAFEALAQALQSEKSNPDITPDIRRTISELRIYPHFNNTNFNTPADAIPRGSREPTICIIHVGKCAGESIIETMKKIFPNTSAHILEYHVFDANKLIQQAITKTSNDPLIHWIILTRDPAERWVSAFNWDYHTFGANSYFYSHPIAKDCFKRFQRCSDLIKGLQQGDEVAVDFSRFHHLAYGHIAMGQSWYLTESLIQLLKPERTSVIRTEHIAQDLEACITKISAQVKDLRLDQQNKIPIIHTKNNYQQRYKPGTFDRPGEIDSQQLEYLQDFLKEDYQIHKSAIQKFILGD